MSSVAQLEAEISTYFLEGGGYIWPPGIPVLIEIWVSNSYWHTWPQLLIKLWKFCVARSFSFSFIITNVGMLFARCLRGVCARKFPTGCPKKLKCAINQKVTIWEWWKWSRKLLLGYLSKLVRSKVKAPFWPGIAPTWQLTSAEKGGPISLTL